MLKPESQEQTQHAEIENKLILVYYVSIHNIPENHQNEFLTKIHDRISLDKETIPNFGAALIIPTYGENRVECINPVYITDSDLIKKHERLMAELHECMNTFLTNIKNKKIDNE